MKTYYKYWSRYLHDSNFSLQHFLYSQKRIENITVSCRTDFLISRISIATVEIVYLTTVPHQWPCLS